MQQKLRLRHLIFMMHITYELEKEERSCSEKISNHKAGILSLPVELIQLIASDLDFGGLEALCRSDGFLNFTISAVPFKTKWYLDRFSYFALYEAIKNGERDLPLFRSLLKHLSFDISFIKQDRVRFNEEILAGCGSKEVYYYLKKFIFAEKSLFKKYKLLEADFSVLNTGYYQLLDSLESYSEDYPTMSAIYGLRILAKILKSSHTHYCIPTFCIKALYTVKGIFKVFVDMLLENAEENLNVAAFTDIVKKALDNSLVAKHDFTRIIWMLKCAEYDISGFIDLFECAYKNKTLVPSEVAIFITGSFLVGNFEIHDYITYMNKLVLFELLVENLDQRNYMYVMMAQDAMLIATDEVKVRYKQICSFLSSKRLEIDDLVKYGAVFIFDPKTESFDGFLSFLHTKLNFTIQKILDIILTGQVKVHVLRKVVTVAIKDKTSVVEKLKNFVMAYMMLPLDIRSIFIIAKEFSIDLSDCSLKLKFNMYKKGYSVALMDTVLGDDKVFERLNEYRKDLYLAILKKDIYMVEFIHEVLHVFG